MQTDTHGLRLEIVAVGGGEVKRGELRCSRTHRLCQELSYCPSGAGILVKPAWWPWLNSVSLEEKCHRRRCSVY